MKLTDAEPLTPSQIIPRIKKRRAALNPINALRFLKIFLECLDRLTSQKEPQDLIITESNMSFKTLQNRLNEALFYLCNFDISNFPCSYTNRDFNRLRASIRFLNENITQDAFPIKIRVHFRLPQEDQIFFSTDWQKEILDFINTPCLELKEVQLTRTTPDVKDWITLTLQDKGILYYYNKRKVLLIREAVEDSPKVT